MLSSTPALMSQSPADVGLPLATTQGLQLATQSDVNSLIVRALGRTVSLPTNISSLMDVQHALQAEMGMKDQSFEICDCYGAKLLTDMDLRNTLTENRLPLSATLTDSSIHFIENRREELAQMQWKLVRDGNNQLALKLTAVCRQVAGLETAIEAEKRDRQHSLERLESEIYAALEGVREGARVDCRELDERVTGVSHLVSAERSMREAAMQRISGDMQGLREIADADRVALHNSSAQASNKFDEAKQLIDQERSLREALEHKCGIDLEGVIRRMDEITNNVQEVVNEYSRAMEKASAEINAVIDNHARNTMKGHNELETKTLDAASRLGLLEGRHSSLENRLTENMQRQAELIDRLNQRSEKVNQAVESLRYDTTKQVNSVDEAKTKVKEFDSAVLAMQAELRDTIEKERKRREDDHRSLMRAVMTESGTKISLLEGKLMSRLERESSAREGTISEIMAKFDVSFLKDVGKSGANSPGHSRSVSSICPSPAPSSRPGSLTRRTLTTAPSQSGSLAGSLRVEPGGARTSSNPPSVRSGSIGGSFNAPPPAQGQLPVRPSATYQMPAQPTVLPTRTAMPVAGQPPTLQLPLTMAPVMGQPATAASPTALSPQTLQMSPRVTPQQQVFVQNPSAPQLGGYVGGQR